MRTKEIGNEIFGELGNLALEENRKDQMTRKVTNVLTHTSRRIEEEIISSVKRRKDLGYPKEKLPSL